MNKHRNEHVKTCTHRETRIFQPRKSDFFLLFLVEIIIFMKSAVCIMRKCIAASSNLWMNFRPRKETRQLNESKDTPLQDSSMKIIQISVCLFIHHYPEGRKRDAVSILRSIYCVLKIYSKD